MTKKLLLLGALALVAFAAGCSSDECSTASDCADKGSNFVCTNGTCVQHTPMDGGTSCNPACSGDTPICNQSTLTCVQCTQDSECGGDTPSCDVAHNTCVACSNNADCEGSADGPACDTSSHTCVACVANGDCDGSADGPACDTSTHTCVACTTNASCLDPSAPVCDTSTHACVACLSDANCTDDAPVCDTTSHTCGCSADTDCADSTTGHVCDTANKVCVACNANTDCSGATPVCDTANHTCTAACGSDTDCAATPATPVCGAAGLCVACDATHACATGVCDTSNDTCVECVGNTDCASNPNGGACDTTSHTCGCAAETDCAGTAGTPSCNTQTHACVAACALQTDCDISQDCTDGGAGLFCVDVDVAAASTAIDAIRTAAVAGTTTSTQQVVGAIVTYVKPAVGSEAPGFFVQAEAAGPALYVAIDPATLSPQPAVGDRVSFTATTLAYVNKQPQVTALSDLSQLSSGHDASALLTDVSAAADVVSALDTYDSRLIGMGFTITAAPTNANAGYMATTVDTAGLSGSSSLKFYAPSEIFSQKDLTNGCVAQITNGVMFRYNTTAEPAVWDASNLTVTSCPAPTVLSASRVSATEVDVTFDRNIDPLSIAAAGFTITETDTPANTLAVTGATFDSNDLRKAILTTATQSPGVGYTLTVGSTVKDDLGVGVDAAANTATFSGYVGAAVLRLTEINPGITGSKDLIELTATTGGALDGLAVYYLGTATPIVAFPSMVVGNGDVLLIHINTSGGCTETAGKADCAAASNADYVDTAWDFASSNSGLAFSARVIALEDAAGNILDGMPYTNSSTNDSSVSASFPGWVQSLQSAGVWDPSGTCTDKPSCRAISVEINGLGTDSTSSAHVTSLASPMTAANWSISGAASFGTYDGSGGAGGTGGIIFGDGGSGGSGGNGGTGTGGTGTGGTGTGGTGGNGGNGGTGGNGGIGGEGGTGGQGLAR